MIELALNNNKGFSWFSKNDVHFKGYFWNNSGELFENEKAVGYFQDISTQSELTEVIKNVNGLFAVVIKKNQCIYAATDRIRTFPLFYSIQNGEFTISDNTSYFLKTRENNIIRDAAAREYLSLGFVTGCDTLLTDVFQVEAGQVLTFDNSNNTLSKFSYFTYGTNEINSENEIVLNDKLNDIVERVTERLVKQLKGRPVAIPLSGGYDSRLIALMLKKAKYPNVICYTFGRKGNPELENSQKAATTLGFPWCFVDYLDISLNEYYESQQFNEYYQYAANHSSMYHLMEYFALNYLKEKNIITADHVVIPGHSGDFLGGSHLNSSLKGNLSLDKIATNLVLKNFSFKPLSLKELKTYKHNIKNSLVDGFFSHSIFEAWDMKERQAKFIVNACRVYEFYGHEFMLPLWDNELMEFFKVLPFEKKIFKRFYNDFLKSYFESYHLNFKHELQPSKKTYRKQQIKDKIIKWFPFVKRLKSASIYDSNCYYEITQPMKKILEKNNIPDYQNSLPGSILVNWYVNKVKHNI
jgi:asparagine synthase (glutamine-hydrolysing)